jgi:hypothetical protein
MGYNLEVDPEEVDKYLGKNPSIPFDRVQYSTPMKLACRYLAIFSISKNLEFFTFF